MALTKVRAGGVTLSDNFAFTGTVSGVGMDLLLNDTISSSTANYIISSTYINGSYDSYHLDATFLGTLDGRYFYGEVYVGGSLITSSSYAYEVQVLGAAYSSGGFNSNGDSVLNVFNTAGAGSADGEGITISATYQNTNSILKPFCSSGFTSHHNTSGNHEGYAFTGSMTVANRASVVNGLRFRFSGGDIASGTVKLYGLRK